MTLSHGFELLREEYIDELNSTAKLYRYVKNGARFLSIENDDENKVFGVTFRTPPDDSTGVPHILEHAVLGGSRKYRVKEPFVELIKGSLKTFVNAMTFPDKTAYPVASTNEQDFYNLVDVYLDAVFYPLLTPHHLEQEGWHYELENIDDPIIYKGIVFNEMKGAYSSPDRLLYRYNQSTIFPDTTYGVDSGGDPQSIPDLTYEQFKGFHETYYHPSNAYLFFYGDDDPEKRLKVLDEYLRDFSAAQIDSTVALQPVRTEPIRLVMPYSVDEANGEDGDAAPKPMVSLNWLLPEATDQVLSAALSILSYAILGTPASPMRKALLDSGLGEDITGGGVSGGTRQMTFSVGMKGVKAENIEKVEALIIDSLETLAAEGIEPEMLESAINSIEFSLRENNTGSYPRGLVLMFRVLGSWIYDRDPYKSLSYATPLAETKAKIANEPEYLQNLIRTYLLENDHRSTVVLEPDTTLRQKEEAAEKDRLQTVRAGMSAEQLQAIIKNTQVIKARQEAPDPPEELATIPRLTLADMEPKSNTIPLEEIDLNGTKVLYHDLGTNGIIYLRLGFDLHALPADLLPLVDLFGDALVEIGTERENYVQLSQRIGRKTGGVGTSSFVSTDNDGKDAAWFFVGGKATPDNAVELLAIITDILTTVQLDNQERFQQILLESKSYMESSLIPSGNAYTGSRLNAGQSVSGWASEQIDGIENLFYMRKLADEVANDWPAVLSRLERIRDLLINRSTLICNVTLDAANWSAFQPQLTEFIDTLPATDVPTQQWSPNLIRINEGLTIPAQVNYITSGANLFELGYTLHGSIAPITNFLRTTWLWDKIRVQGGAYGGRCGFSRRSGLFTFGSYRDPNLLGTVENFDGAANFLKTLELSDDELTKSIIGSIGSIDGYQLPDAKGRASMMRYLLGESDVERQKYRDEVLSTTAADFRAFADVLHEMNKAANVIVMGPHEGIAEANKVKGEDWLKVIKVQ